MDFISISNSEQQHFIPMTQKHVDDCKGRNIKMYSTPNVVNHLATWLETCEIAFFKRVTPPLNVRVKRITSIGTSLCVQEPTMEHLKILGRLLVFPQEESLTTTCLGPDGHPEHDGTGILTLPTKCQMVGSTCTLSRIPYKSLEKFNIRNVIKIR